MNISKAKTHDPRNATDSNDINTHKKGRRDERPTKLFINSQVG